MARYAGPLTEGAPVHVWLADGPGQSAIAGEVVTRNETDGTFDVLLDDGTRREALDPEQIRPLLLPETRVDVHRSFMGAAMREFRVALGMGGMASTRSVRRVGAESGPLGVGDVVCAKYRSSTAYYPARVATVNGDGTFGIDYDDGDHMDALDAESIERTVPATVAPPVVGDRVVAITAGGRCGYMGHVRRVLDARTFDVDTGGRTDGAVPAERIHVVGAGAVFPADPLEPGDAVMALVGGVWRDAVLEGWHEPEFYEGSSVVRLNADGLFQCKHAPEPVPLSALRVPPLPGAPEAAPNEVQARWKGGTKLYKAVIKAHNADGTLQVRYEDGDFDAAVPPTSIVGTVALQEGTAVLARLPCERRWVRAVLRDAEQRLVEIDGAVQRAVAVVAPPTTPTPATGTPCSLGAVGRRVRVRTQQWYSVHNGSGVVFGDGLVLKDDGGVLDKVAVTDVSDFDEDAYDFVLDELGDAGDGGALPVGTIVRVRAFGTLGVVKAQAADHTYLVAVNGRTATVMRRPELERVASGAALSRDPLAVGDVVQVWASTEPRRVQEALEEDLYRVAGEPEPVPRLLLRRVGDDPGPLQLLSTAARERLVEAWKDACREAGGYAVAGSDVLARLTEPIDLFTDEPDMAAEFAQALCLFDPDAEEDEAAEPDSDSDVDSEVDDDGDEDDDDSDADDSQDDNGSNARSDLHRVRKTDLEALDGPDVAVRALRRLLRRLRVSRADCQVLVEHFDPLELDVVPLDAVVRWCFPKSRDVRQRLRAQLSALLPRGLEEALERAADRQGRLRRRDHALALRCFGAVVGADELRGLPKTVRSFVRWVREAAPGSGGDSGTGRCRIEAGELLLELATADPAAVAAHVAAAGANVAAVAFEEAADVSGKELEALVPLLPASLRVLRLVGCPVRDRGLAALAPHLASLEVLRLDCQCTITVAGARHVAALAGSLTELEAVGCAWGAEGARELCALRRLRRLQLVDCQVDSEAVRALCDGLPALESLDLGSSTLLEDPSALQSAAALTSLRACLRGGRMALPATLQELRVGHMQTPPDVGSLTALSGLRVLRLAAHTVTGTLTALVKALPQLQDIELHRCQLNQDAVDALGQRPGLESLAMTGTGLAGDLDLSPLASLRSLRTLKLPNQGRIRTLGAGYPQLRELGLAGCSGVDPLEVAAIVSLQKVSLDAPAQLLAFERLALLPRLLVLQVVGGGGDDTVRSLKNMQHRVPRIDIVYDQQPRELSAGREVARKARVRSAAQRWALILAWRARGSALTVVPAAGVRVVACFL